MIELLGSLSLTTPMALAGFLALPLLWRLFRLIPPSPSIQDFPPFRFLLGREETPPVAKPPLWLILLRLLIVSSLIVAMAGPYLASDRFTLPDSEKTIHLVIDNGWSSAPVFGEITGSANAILNKAERNNQPVILQVSVPPNTGFNSPNPVSAASARSKLAELAPQPVPADYTTLKTDIPAPFQTLWLGDGVYHKGFEPLMKTLSDKGRFTYFKPPAAQTALAFGSFATGIDHLETEILSLDKNRKTSLRLLDKDNQVIDSHELPVNQRVKIEVEPSILRNATKAVLAEKRNAGAVWLIRHGQDRKVAGLLRESRQTGQLEDPLYYLETALSGLADIQKGTLEAFTKDDVTMILLAEGDALAETDQALLSEWIKNGGYLIRFAGPGLAQSPDALTPAPILGGGRAMDGGLTWDQPQAIAPFPERSPFYGIDVPDTPMIRRQILTDPSSLSRNDTQIWASLKDGTPLVTAAPRGAGYIVLIHTTAAPDWNDLALSGVFIRMLQRLAALSPARLANDGAAGLKTQGKLTPFLLLDGYGGLQIPDEKRHRPLEANQAFTPTPETPPGFYQGQGYVHAFNLGAGIGFLRQASDVLPQGAGLQLYQGAVDIDLRVFFIMAALGLLCIDLLLMMFLQNILRFITSWKKTGMAGLILAAMLMGAPNPARAQSPSPSPAELSQNLYFAYVKTGNPVTDSEIERGLNRLAETLDQRTSAAPQGTVGIIPGQDALALFPFIYWPVTQGQILDEKAAQAVQDYIDYGGLILFDTRDQKYGSAASSANVQTNGTRDLRRLLRNVSLPQLSLIADDHVLKKSYYLLDSLSGVYADGPVWVASRSNGESPDVSSVILGGHDWAGAWGNEIQGRLSSREDELALRSGINIVMYALTGTYKGDQVHLPHILERLGQ